MHRVAAWYRHPDGHVHPLNHQQPKVSQGTPSLRAPQAGLYQETGTLAMPSSQILPTARRCHYAGRLTDGTVFDSSYQRRQPLSFQVGIKPLDVTILCGCII